MDPLEFLLASKRIQNVYGRFCQQVCQKYHINQTAFDILMFFANHPNFNTARDICTVRGIKSGIASVTVEALIRRGYLTRSGDPTDRRIHRLQLSAHAQPLVEEGRRIQAEFAAALSIGIPPDELASTRRVMEQIINNLKTLDKGAAAHD